jgi:hypothetical protein
MPVAHLGKSIRTRHAGALGAEPLEVEFPVQAKDGHAQVEAVACCARAMQGARHGVRAVM